MSSPYDLGIRLMGGDERCRVTLLPGNKMVRVAPGALLSEALEAAGLPMSLPCGGQGRCGRCLVIVRDGSVHRRSVARLTPAEIAQGYALACQTVIEGNVTIEVPAQEAILARPEAATAASKAASEELACEHHAPPALDKYHLTIAPPSLEDNTTDWERVQRELARQHGLFGVTTTLPVLRRLAGTLRSAEWDVTVTLETAEAVSRLVSIAPGDTRGRILGLAIDIGTTSNVVYLLDVQHGVVLDRASTYNGQIACGEDVISRIIYARREGGLQRLQDLVMQTLNGLIDELLTRNGVAVSDSASFPRVASTLARRRESSTPTDELVLATVAGNPTMIHLFLGLDPQHIRLEPYIPTLNRVVPVYAGELGLHMHPAARVDCLPGVGAYVGADITAGVLRSGMADEAGGESSSPVTLFIDVGTNGEMVLGNIEWLVSCACSAGPAFEGAGVDCGMRATAGAIDEVWIDPANAEPTYRTIGAAAPRGICGSGMISLLGELFVTGVIDKSGHLNRGLNTPRVRVGANGAEYVVAWAAESATGQRDIVLTEVDIENLMRAKASIYAGASVLVQSVGLDMASIERVLIGGAFGQYIDIEKAIDIGLLPDLPWERFRYLGNTSVQGAALALLCREHRAQVDEIASKMTYLELSADNSFMEAFTSALFLPHTDMGQFQSVADKLRSTTVV